jgi:hypothetical protein
VEEGWGLRGTLAVFELSLPALRGPQGGPEMLVVQLHLGKYREVEAISVPCLCFLLYLGIHASCYVTLAATLAGWSSVIPIGEEPEALRSQRAQSK